MAWRPRARPRRHRLDERGGVGPKGTMAVSIRAWSVARWAIQRIDQRQVLLEQERR